jgi:predicted metal-dependent HD superfamily phosphohydrolase
MSAALVVSMASPDVMEADVVNIQDWDGFVALASYLEAHHAARSVEKIDGPESRVWKIQIADVQISLHHNPDGNHLKAVGRHAHRVLKCIVVDLEERLRNDAFLSDVCATHLAASRTWLSEDCLPPSLQAQLARRYSEPHRRYHTLAHIEALLAHLSAYHHLAKEPELIAAAIWFHDAIYDTQRNDNEELSAQLAQTELERVGWSSSRALSVADMVRATQHHHADESDTDLLLFLDFDLSILGASPASYAAYCAAIRFEFSWASDADYSRGRARVLESFMAREAIYKTPALRDAWEGTARINLQRELATLR